MLKYHPSVFAVGKCYQIIITTKSQSFISVKIGDKLFVDDSNGILKSASRTHNIEVPQELLDSEKHYTIIEKCIIKRLPYFTKTRKDKFFEYDFSPVTSDNPRCYHISDAHNDSVNCVKAAKFYKDIDFLILNGDVPEDSGNVKNFNTIFEICSEITEGRIPVVFARGNHDLRGIYAEKFSEYLPKCNGKTYYSFRLGSIWGLCLDCGEDKSDDHEEYGFSVACHQFREKETEYIKSLIDNCRNEYDDKNVKLKLIIVHSPFTHKFESPFDIEPEIYSEWSLLLKDYIKPDLMLCGHTHKIGIYPAGCDYDTYGQPCTVVVASEPYKWVRFIGSGFEFGDKSCTMTLTDSSGKTEDPVEIRY